ncbi:MAG TPA: FAD-binding oxidoreductase [Thermoanaerobaculaceae bacterium]|nr:FAD-binding oxidoreductase [Thermoanaerobaculaceae bacterium]
MPHRERRWNGWGWADERVQVSASARTWLAERVGTGVPLAAAGEQEIRIPPARTVPALGAATSREPADRLRTACGLSFPDVVRLRTGAVEAFPDAVCRPGDAGEVVAVLRAAAARGVAVVVRGGGTSVVGGVTVTPRTAPTVVLALDRVRGLVALDRASRLATLRAGTLGPEVEAALAPSGMRLGHEPQSFEFSSVGGWIATRSAGQRSTGVGKIDELVAGLEVATPAGIWRLPPQPASAAGPEARRLLIGSEGRLGVITEATLRVRPQPERRDGVAVLVPGWSDGLEACRSLVQRGPIPEIVRLSDPGETGFGLALADLPYLASRVRDAISAVRRFRHGCLLLLEWAGTTAEVTAAREDAAPAWSDVGGLVLGRAPWRRWLADRFRHPYLRDELLSAGWGIDTLETAAPWSAIAALHASVREAMTAAAETAGFGAVVLCHLSHAYRDGAALYFTFLWPLRRGGEVGQWRALKESANRAILAGGGTITHHHGVGTMHAPYLEREIGSEGVAALRGAATAVDPHGVLNPGVLLPEPSAHATGDAERV